MNILIDGMGGDFAPYEILKGAVKAAKEIDETITIIGPENTIIKEIKNLGFEGNNIKIVDSKEVITNNESPAMAVKKKKDSTIVRGMEMLKDGEGDVFISAGSTGALLSAGLLKVGRIKGIKRPAIAAFFPKIGKNDTTLLLDCGANVETKALYLAQFGIMGSVFISGIKKKVNPEIKLLNIGVEAEKGDDLHKEAYSLLQKTNINFTGNIEARDVANTDCDVVVTDGFSGNIFLKSSEGVAISIMKRIINQLKNGIFSKVGMLLSVSKLKELKKEFDYSEEGGAPILGLKGAVLKIHGNSKEKAVYKAILKSVDYVKADITGKIENSILEFNENNGDI